MNDCAQCGAKWFRWFGGHHTCPLTGATMADMLPHYFLPEQLAALRRETETPA